MPKGIYVRLSEEERFWKYVDKKDEGECWPWKGSKDKDGYGWFKIKQDSLMNQVGKNISASRYSLMRKLNDFNLDSTVLARHTCDNRHCVNPNHLIPGSAAENSADMVERNRQTKGEQHHSAIITEETAKNILKDYTNECDSGRRYGSHLRLAEKYGIDKQVVNRLVSGKTWKHLHGSTE